MLLASALFVVGCGNKTGAGSSGDPSVTPSASTPPPPPPPPPQPFDPAKGAPLSFAPIAKGADPSVVTIQVVAEIEVAGRGGTKRRKRAEGLGSGFIIDKDGTILTNHHVVDSARKITVRLSDEREFPARVIGTDQPTDIGVIQIENDKARPATFLPISLGDSDKMEVGDWVVAIGNPFGLEHTVSAGIVSAKNRTQKDVPLDPSGYYNFIQTDAAINQGNSGGPLLDLKGQVIGINSAIRGGGAQNIGFAIPINMVKQLLPMLLRDGHITRSALGIEMVELRQLGAAERAQFKISQDLQDGVFVDVVAPGSGAESAGLQPGDVIVSFDGTPTQRGTHLQWLASTTGVGKTVSVKVIREGKEIEKKVRLGMLPSH